MTNNRFKKIFTAFRNQITGRFPDGEARLLCYLAGPFSGLLMLCLRNYGRMFAVRFHAFHSMLLTAFWATAALALWVVEESAPWFLGTIAGEARFAWNLGFLFVWGSLLVTAYRGIPLVIVPQLHHLANQLAHRWDAHPAQPNATA